MINEKDAANIRTTAAAQASFHAASRTADMTRGGLVLNVASAVGLLLRICPGPRSALEAAHRMPNDPIWKAVVQHLEGLVWEERHGDTEPPMSIAVGQR